jgi:hypothetical protein
MKVKQLIEILQKADPELTVVTFQDGGAEEIGDLDVYNVEYMIKHEKLGVFRKRDTVVGIGWPGNFDETASHEDCTLVQELT